MSRSNVFRIDEHEIDCQHIREYQRATAGSQETVLRLAIKQYTPKDNLNPADGDITIIGSHANGFPKELYEPLWEEIYLRLKLSGIKIRGIWIADVAHQGASGILNENLLGNDPSWFDHSRDLLSMINHFRSQIKMPLVGVGHSMGGCHLANLSLMHPRLLSSLILIDPVIQVHDSPPYGPAPAAMSTFRRDVWPSREAAMAAFQKNKLYQSWHPSVLDRFTTFGLRTLPTAIQPESITGRSASDLDQNPVTLTSSRHQEVFTFLRPDYDVKVASDGTKFVDRVYAPDRNPQEAAVKKVPGLHEAPSLPQFYRPEPIITFHNLPFLRPSVLYIFGGDSPMSLPEFQDAKMATTGTGVGGSGGQKEGKVKKVVMEGIGHLVPFDAVEQTGIACAAFLETEVRNTLQQMATVNEKWHEVPLEKKAVVDDTWISHMRGAKDKWSAKL